MSTHTITCNRLLQAGCGCDTPHFTHVNDHLGIMGEPMRQHIMTYAEADRYAAALEHLASSSADASRWLEHLSVVHDLLKDQPRLMKHTRLPAFRQFAISAIWPKLAHEMNLPHPLRRLLIHLTLHQQLKALPTLIRAFSDRLARASGRQTVIVTSKKPLTPAQQAALSKRLETMLNVPTTLDVRQQPTLLGGMKIKIGAYQIDATLDRQLQQLAHRLKRRTS